MELLMDQLMTNVECVVDMDPLVSKLALKKLAPNALNMEKDVYGVLHQELALIKFTLYNAMLLSTMKLENAQHSWD